METIPYTPQEVPKTIQDLTKVVESIKLNTVKEFSSRLLEKNSPITKEDILDELAFYIGRECLSEFADSLDNYKSC